MVIVLRRRKHNLVGAHMTDPKDHIARQEEKKEEQRVGKQEHVPLNPLVQGVPFSHCESQSRLLLAGIGRLERLQEQAHIDGRADRKVLFAKLDLVTEGITDLRIRVGKLEGEVNDLHAARGEHSLAIGRLHDSMSKVSSRVSGVSNLVDLRNWKTKWLFIGVGAVLMFILSLIVKTIWPNTPL